MLAKINWIFFTKKEKYDERLPALQEAIRHELREAEKNRDCEPTAEGEDDQGEVLNFHMMDGNSVLLSDEMGEGGEDEPEELTRSVVIPAGGLNRDFWDRHFGTRTEATWIEFKEKFLADYSERITKHFGKDKEKWAIHLIYSDIFELHKTVDKSTYTKFCGRNTKGDPHLFFNRLKDYAIGSFAMREVFDMDSTVRLTAIQNLGKLCFIKPRILIIDLKLSFLYR